MVSFISIFLTYLSACTAAVWTSCEQGADGPDRNLEQEVAKHQGQGKNKKKKSGNRAAGPLRGAIEKKECKKGSPVKSAGLKNADVKKKDKVEDKGQPCGPSQPRDTVGPVMAGILARNKAMREKKRKLFGDGVPRNLYAPSWDPVDVTARSRPIRKVTVVYGCGLRRSAPTQ